MTPEEFLERNAAERALRDQLQATGQEVTQDTLKGCALALVQLAHALKLNHADVSELVREEWGAWELYVKAKQRLAEKRKGAK